MERIGHLLTRQEKDMLNEHWPKETEVVEIEAPTGAPQSDTVKEDLSALLAKQTKTYQQFIKGSTEVLLQSQRETSADFRRGLEYITSTMVSEIQRYFAQLDIRVSDAGNFSREEGRRSCTF